MPHDADQKYPPAVSQLQNRIEQIMVERAASLTGADGKPLIEIRWQSRVASVEAREDGVRMPSFFGYMLWSCGILLPLFAALTWLFFA